MTGNVAWVAHAGLAISRPGGAPDELCLVEAVRLRPDWLELDVRATADGELVLHHDACVRGGGPVAALDLAELRRCRPEILTLDAGLECAGDLPLLLDVKSEAAAGPLGGWLARRSSAGRFTVCTDIVPVLAALRRRVPGVGRWLSLPDLGEGSRQALRRVAAAFWRQRHPRGLLGVGREMARAAADARLARRDLLARLAGIPWRLTLPPQVRHLASDVAAGALTVQHWVITPQLCEEAHRLGLPLVAWTVNRPDAVRRVVGCGADAVTTDLLEAMRGAA